MQYFLQGVKKDRTELLKVVEHECIDSAVFIVIVIVNTEPFLNLDKEIYFVCKHHKDNDFTEDVQKQLEPQAIRTSVDPFTHKLFEFKIISGKTNI